jgi:hypothetical protein
MVLGYRISTDFTDEELQARRQMLDKYGTLAVSSSFVPVFAVQLVFLCR